MTSHLLPFSQRPYFAFVLSLVFFASPVRSAQIQTENACYKVFLVGHMLDSYLCKDTVVDITELDCESKRSLRSSLQKVSLLKCSSNFAQGTLFLNSRAVSFSARRSNSLGMEVWQIEDSSLPPPNQKAKTDRATSSAKIEASSTPPAPPSSDGQEMSFPPPLVTKVQSNFLIGASSFSTNQTATPGARLVDNLNSYRTVDLLKQGFSLHHFLIDNHWRPHDLTVHTQLGLGPEVDVWTGADLRQSETLRLVEMSLLIPQVYDGSLLVGLFASPLRSDTLWSGWDQMVTRSLISTLAQPHRHMGVLYSRPGFLSGQWGLLVSNSWDDAINADQKIGWAGFVRIHPWENHSSQISYFNGTRRFGTSSLPFTSILWRHSYRTEKTLSEINWAYGTGQNSSTNSLSWTAFDVGLQYNHSDKLNLSGRFESFINDQGFLLGNSQVLALTSFQLSSHYRLEENLFSFLELRGDFPSQRDPGASSDEGTHTAVLTGVSWEI